MSYTKIIDKINKAIENLETDNIIANFPSIIEDLYYIYFTLKHDKDSLDSKEKFYHSKDISAKIMEYFAKLTEKYMKLIHNTNVNIKNVEDYNLAMASGGYNSNNDVKEYNSFGLTLGRQNTTSYLETFLHESRHKMQHATYNTNDVEVET